MESYRVRMLFGNPGPMHPTAFLNHEKLIINHIEYDEEFVYAQDYNLWMRISSIGQICILPEVLLYYRTHSGQISKEHFEKQRKYAQMTQRQLLEQLFGNVTEDDLYFHNTHSSRYGYDENTKISYRVIQWYGKIISANKIRKIYHRKKLVRHIEQVKFTLIVHSFTKDMSLFEKGLLLFQYLPFATASKAVLCIIGMKACRCFYGIFKKC